MKQDMATPANVSSYMHYTLVFPRREYLIDHQLFFNLTTHQDIDHKVISIIGLSVDLNALLNDWPSPYSHGISGTFYDNYINDHLSTNDLVCPTHDPANTSFLTYAAGNPFPTIRPDIIPHDYELIRTANSVNIGTSPYTLRENTMNIMGLELSSVNGSTEYIFPNPFYPPDSVVTGSPAYFALTAEHFGNAWLDNIRIRNLWGSGLLVFNEANTFQNSYTSTAVEVRENMILNTWARTNYHVPACAGISFLGVKNGIVEHNLVFNDVKNVTHQLAGGIGISTCVEWDKNITVTENWVNGFEFSYWIESNGGGISILKNRSSETEHGLVVSSNVGLYPPASPYLVHRIEHNYFTNAGLDPSYPDYCAQYNYKQNKQVFFDQYTQLNNFTTFKHNSIVVDETAYINCRRALNGPYEITDHNGVNPHRVLFDAEQQDYLELNCNHFINTAPTPSQHSYLYYHPAAATPTNGWHSWILGNECTNLKEINHSCTPYENGNTYNAISSFIPSACGNTTTLTGCDRDYQFMHQSIGSGLYLDYSMYDACDMMTGTFSFRASGGNPAYEFLVDGVKIGYGKFEDGTITNVEEGTHILTVMDSNIPTPNVGTFVFTIKSNPNHLFTNGNSSTLATNIGSGSLQDKSLLIDGTFTIDNSFTFTNCFIFLQPNAKIVVEHGKTLTLNGCTLKASCNAMWDGIYAADPDAEIVLNESTLQDMENGVVVSNNAKINAIGNTFNDNLFGIVLKKNSGATTCTVTNNTFQKLNGLIAPHASDVKPFSGIYISDCSDISIGDMNDITSGNTFQDVWNGINIENTKSTTYSNANIHLNYNKFQDINSNGTAWGSSFVISPRGAGIYAYNRNNASNLKIKVKGNTGNGQTNFDQCDKGVLLRKVSAEVYENKLEQSIVGIYFSECAGRSYKVLNNTLLNTELGIAKYGDENASGFYATGNTILLSNPLDLNQLNITSPTGILSAYSSGKSNIGASYIQNNTIDIPLGFKAVGISLSEGSKDFITGNTIHLTPTAGATLPEIPTLVGIYSNNSSAPSIINNVVDNNYSVNGNTNFVPGNNAGIYVNANDVSRIQCNTTNFTKYGLFAVGKNGSTSDYTLTASNTMRCAKADMMFWALGNEGTFGQVGKEISLIPPLAYDANNNFLANPTLNKVYRVTSCPTLFHDQIVTTNAKLNANESGTNAGSSACQTDVVNPIQPFSQTHSCAAIFGVTPEDMDIPFAEDVAEDEIVYEDFDEGARRADEEMIYTWLANHETARTANPVLDSFYLSHYADIVGQISRIEEALSALSDSTLMADSTLWQSKVDSISQLNYSLGDEHVFEENAKLMNGHYLSVLEYGVDTLNAEVIEAIGTLALTCPYTGGTSVYRARSILGMLNPGMHYDDLVICNSQGMYKNGVNKLQAQLYSLIDAEQKKHLDDVGIKVYPNPATSIITIQYELDENEQAKLIVFDILGNKVREEVLYNDITNKTIEIGDLASGLYVYQFRSSHNDLYFGKLLIE